MHSVTGARRAAFVCLRLCYVSEPELTAHPLVRLLIRDAHGLHSLAAHSPIGTARKEGGAPPFMHATLQYTTLLVKSMAVFKVKVMGRPVSCRQTSAMPDVTGAGGPGQQET